MANAHILNDNEANLNLATEACTGRPEVQWVTFAGRLTPPKVPVHYLYDFPSGEGHRPPPPQAGACVVVQSLPFGQFNWKGLTRLLLGFAEDQGGVDVYLLVQGLPEDQQRSGSVADVLDTLNESEG